MPFLEAGKWDFVHWDWDSWKKTIEKWEQHRLRLWDLSWDLRKTISWEMGLGPPLHDPQLSKPQNIFKICPFCHFNDVKNELHFIIFCHLYNNHLRLKFLEDTQRENTIILMF